MLLLALLLMPAAPAKHHKRKNSAAAGALEELAATLAAPTEHDSGADESPQSGFSTVPTWKRDHWERRLQHRPRHDSQGRAWTSSA
mmetsp:Transcript_51011/g.164804  ORF Transcript_51011/g.164804 Transcript_51011/m.164804 type:complete len:86 (-) Transcript_51011:290-547(-)